MSPLVAITLISIGIYACKEPSIETSSTQHRFNEGPIERTSSYDCEEGKMRWEEFTKEKNDLIDDYVTKIGLRIYQSNLDYLSKEKIGTKLCFQADDTTGTGAGARPQQGEVRIEEGLIFHMAKNDSYVAAAMAHELAHVALNHNIQDDYVVLVDESTVRKLGPASLNRFRNLLNEEKEALQIALKLVRYLTPQFEELSNAEEKKCLHNGEKSPGCDLVKVVYRLNSNLRNHGISVGECQKLARPWHKNTMTNFSRLMNTIEDPKIFKPNTFDQIQLIYSEAQKLYRLCSNANSHLEDLLAEIRRELGEEYLRNGNEQEADELGLELYLRSGFKLEHFLAAFESFDFRDSSVDAKCTRGDSTHPNRCWRLENLKKEIKLHQIEYQRLKEKTKQLDDNLDGPPSLWEAKLKYRLKHCNFVGVFGCNL